MKTSPYFCVICSKAPSVIVGRGLDYEYGTSQDSFSFALCPSCNHMFLANRPNRKYLQELYPPTYYTINPESPIFLKGFTYRTKITMDLHRLSKFILEINAKSILELGCGDCFRLIQLKRRLNIPGLQITGVDLQSTSTIRENVKRENIGLIEGDIESLTTLSQAGTNYDVIIMSQLIEHLFDPRTILQFLFTLLNPRGIIVIETPNWQCLDFRIFKKHYWGGYHFPRHFNVFSPESLSHFLQSCGFTISKQGFLPSPGFWISSLRNCLGLNSKAYSSSFFECINLSSLLIVVPFTVFDMVRMLFKGKTSTQYVVATKPLETSQVEGVMA